MNFRNYGRIDVLDLLTVVIDDVSASSDENEIFMGHMEDPSVDHHDRERVERLSVHQFTKPCDDRMLHARMESTGFT